MCIYFQLLGRCTSKHPDCSCFLFPSNIIIPGMIFLVHSDKSSMGDKSAKDNKYCKSKLISLVRLFRSFDGTSMKCVKWNKKNVADWSPERRINNSMVIYLYSYQNITWPINFLYNFECRTRVLPRIFN